MNNKFMTFFGRNQRVRAVPMSIMEPVGWNKWFLLHLSIWLCWKEMWYRWETSSHNYSKLQISANVRAARVQIMELVLEQETALVWAYTHVKTFLTVRSLQWNRRKELDPLPGFGFYKQYKLYLLNSQWVFDFSALSINYHFYCFHVKIVVWFFLCTLNFLVFCFVLLC